jgi:hypothetical protein
VTFYLTKHPRRMIYEDECAAENVNGPKNKTVFYAFSTGYAKKRTRHYDFLQKNVYSCQHNFHQGLSGNFA